MKMTLVAIATLAFVLLAGLIPNSVEKPGTLPAPNRSCSPKADPVRQNRCDGLQTTRTDSAPRPPAATHHGPSCAAPLHDERTDSTFPSELPTAASEEHRHILCDGDASHATRVDAVTELGNGFALVATDLSHLESLYHASTAPDARATALWAAGRLGTPEAIDFLQRALDTGADDDRMAAILALQETPNPTATEVIRSVLEEPITADLTILAIEALAPRQAERNDLTALLGDLYWTCSDVEVRTVIARSLGLRRSGTEKALLFTISGQANESIVVRQMAIDSLGRLPDPTGQVVAHLERIATSGRSEIAATARSVLDERNGSIELPCTAHDSH